MVGVCVPDSRIALGLLAALMIVQHVTDVLDGAVGRARGSGLVRWGMYMDHLLDYVFMLTLMMAFYLVFNFAYPLVWLGAFLVGTIFMIHSFLVAAATGQFSFSKYRFGTTEMKLILIFITIVGAVITPNVIPVVIMLGLPCLVTLFIVVSVTAQRHLKVLDAQVLRNHPS